MHEEAYKSENFVGRAEEQKTFVTMIGAQSRLHLPVLCFYGVGGVGKSWLLTHLQDFLKSKNASSPASKIAFVRINFGQSPPTSFFNFLYRIACELDKSTITCSEFWMVWYFYQSLTEERDYTPLSKYQPSPPRYTNILSVVASSFVLLNTPSIIAALTNHLRPEFAGLFLAGSGVTYFLVEWISKMLDKSKHFKDGLYKKYHGKNLDELKKALPQALANDISKGSPKSLKIICNSVIFFDTLESTDSRDDVSDVQKWIAALAQIYPRMLVVLTGHNRVHWDNPNSDMNFGLESDILWEMRDWRQQKCFDGESGVTEWHQLRTWKDANLLQFRLQDLSEKDARKLLMNYGVTEMNLCNVILQECREDARFEEDGVQIRREGYHATSLILCVETLKNWPVGQKFALDKTKHESVIGRYLKSLSGTERKRIRELALTPQFDGEAAIAICKTDADSLEWALSRSFVSKITPGLVGDWYLFNSNMRRHILAATRDEGDAQALHKLWYQHWTTRHDPPKPPQPFLSQIKNKLSLKSKETPPNPLHLFAQLAWSHLWYIEPEKAWEQWKELATKVREGEGEQNNKEYLALLRWWDVTDIRQREPQNESEADRVFELADYYWSGGMGISLTLLHKAIECCDRALNFYTKENHTQKWACAQNTKGVYYVNFGETGRLNSLTGKERFKNLKIGLACCELVVCDCRNSYPEEWSNAQRIKGSLLNEIGQLANTPELNEAKRWEKLKQAIECYDLAMDNYRKKDPIEWATIQSNKGTAYVTIGKFTKIPELSVEKRLQQMKKAIECYDLALSIRTKDEFPEDWAQTQESKGTAHYDIGRLIDVPTLKIDEQWQYLKKAVDCYDLALNVYVKYKYYKKWAQINFYKGDTCYSMGRLNDVSDVSDVERRENLKQAVKCYEWSLELFTVDMYPDYWANGQYYKALSEWMLDDFPAALISINYAIKGYYLLGEQTYIEKAKIAYTAIQRRQPAT